MRKFKNIYVEITKACNLKCKFCPSSSVNKHEFLSFDKFKHIIHEIKDYTDGIYLHILGEPLLHKEVFDFIDYASKYVKVSLTTNGHLIKNCYKELANSSLYVLNISLQSINNIEDLEEYFIYLNKLIILRTNKLPIHLRIWNNKENADIRGLNDKLYNLIKNYNFLSYPYINISVADEFIWPNLDHTINENRTNCLGGRSQLGILLNGDVTICCLDYLGNTKIGNIYNNNFNEILKSEDFNRVLKGWNDLNPYFELCKKCTYRNRFRKEK